MPLTVEVLDRICEEIIPNLNENPILRKHWEELACLVADRSSYTYKELTEIVAIMKMESIVNKMVGTYPPGLSQLDAILSQYFSFFMVGILVGEALKSREVEIERLQKMVTKE